VHAKNSPTILLFVLTDAARSSFGEAHVSFPGRHLKSLPVDFGWIAHGQLTYIGRGAWTVEDM
jgi:hypothetical protein